MDNFRHYLAGFMLDATTADLGIKYGRYLERLDELAGNKIDERVRRIESM